MAASLDGKVAIVTGAGKGIGKAVAEAYGAAGATVVVSDLDGAAAETVAAGIDGATANTCDVTDEGQVKALIDGTVKAHGGLHVIVPNAGIAKLAPVTEKSFEDWRAVMSVNLDGVFLCIHHAAPAIIASGGGSIVSMCSITAFAGSPLVADYAAAKAAVLSLTKTAAVELRDHGVRANAICPGFIDTDLVDANKATFEQALGLEAFGGFDAVIEGKQGRYGTVEEVASLAVFLASDRSSFSTGSAFVLDGGADAALL